MVQQTSTTQEVTPDYRAQLWEMANALRNNMDAAEYKNIVLGLIFLKYISDAFEEKHTDLTAQIDQVHQTRPTRTSSNAAL